LVEIKEFLPIHLEKLIEMHAKQKSPTTSFITLDTLPKIGFIVCNEKEYVAAGFLRRLEGGFGQLDTFVTNPESSPKDRNDALNLLAERLINEAKALELRGIYAISSDVSVVCRAVATGFRLLDKVIVGLNL